MRLELTRIGNSRGIRISKPLIAQCGLGDVVELRVTPEGLFIAHRAMAGSGRLPSRKLPVTNCCSIECRPMRLIVRTGSGGLSPARRSLAHRSRSVERVGDQEDASLPCGFPRRNELTFADCPSRSDDHDSARYPARVNPTFRSKTGQVALDQLRAVDRQRLVRELGTV
jgi:hypothetical protein